MSDLKPYEKMQLNAVKKAVDANAADVTEREKRIRELEEQIAEEEVLLIQEKERELSLLKENPFLAFKPYNDEQESMLRSMKKILLACGSNQSGKTTIGGFRCLEGLLGYSNHRKDLPKPPTRWRAIGANSLPVSKTEPHVQRDKIRDLVPRSELVAGSWEKSYNAHSNTLHLKNGSHLQFMSYDMALEKFAGERCHGVWFDEEPPRDIYVENLIRTVRFGGEIIITYTPIYGITWLYDEIYIKGKDGHPDIHTAHLDIYSNPYVSNDEIEKISQNLSERERQVRLKGQYLRLHGLVWSAFDETKHLIDPFPIPSYWKKISALDHGYAFPTCSLFSNIDEEGKIYIVDEYYKKNLTVRMHKPGIFRKRLLLSNSNLNNETLTRDYKELMNFPDTYNGITWCDPSLFYKTQSGKSNVLFSIADEYLERPFRIPIIKADNNRMEGIERIQALFEANMLFIFRGKAPNLVNEIRQYSIDPDTDQPFSENEHRRNDACDCLRYIGMSRPAPSLVPTRRYPSGSIGWELRRKKAMRLEREANAMFS